MIGRFVSSQSKAVLLRSQGISLRVAGVAPRPSNVTIQIPCTLSRGLVVVRNAETTEAATAEAPLGAKGEEFVGMMDIRVGKILSVERHPDADSLYVEKIDVGEPEPRTIVSGLVKYVPADQLADRNVLVLCNLKARNMRGIKSFGMLLCASDKPHERVEPLSPPEGVAVGERVWFGNNREQPEPAKENAVQKKKMWEEVQPNLRTTADRLAAFKDQVMMTSQGPVSAPTLADGNIS